jgi:hypothetical protein
MLLRVLLLAVFFGGLASESRAQIDLGKGMSLRLRGFISATAWMQDQDFTFGNGQNAVFPNPPESEEDRWFGGGDVRNTRLAADFLGPKLADDSEWKINGTVEIDFFGGNNGTGSFAGQQELPRLRLAYAELTNGRTTIQVGQQWSPLWGNIPVSVTHLAFPLGWNSGGLIGWRYPGIFVGQKLTDPDDAVSMDLQFAVLAGNWSGPGSTTEFETAGNASWPQVELRWNVGGKDGDNVWSAYLVGHAAGLDFSGAGVETPDDEVTSWAAELGAKGQLGALLLQGNVYIGHALGQQFAQLNQFGDIGSHGLWLQVGYDFTKNWGLFGFFGLEDPEDEDVLVVSPDTGRLKNEVYAGMLRWRSGPFAVGLEYMLSSLRSGPERVETDGQQISLSGQFTF